jgi:hypothetical protein
LFKRPKKPSHAALSGEQTLRDIERIRPAPRAMSEDFLDHHWPFDARDNLDRLTTVLADSDPVISGSRIE